MHERLDRVGRALVDEQLDGRGDERELHLGRLLEKVVREVVHQLVGVVDAIRELADDPDHGSLCLGLVERVQVLAELGDDAFVLARISSEDVLDDDDGLLNDVGHLRFDEAEEGVNACVRGCLNLDCDAPYRTHGFPHKVDVHL